MKFAYCGYDFFADSLLSLLEDEHQLLKLFTWKTDDEFEFNRRVIAAATELGCPVSLERITSEDLKELSEHGCEVLISAAYPFKIPEYSGFVKYGINVHPSSLPVGRGPWPLPWTILKGLKSTAVTFHKLSSEFDTGEILLKSNIVLGEREDLETLSAKLQMTAKTEISNMIDRLPRLWENASPQTDGGYWPMPQKVDRTLEWNKPLLEIDRVYRAFGKFESVAEVDGREIWISEMSGWLEKHPYGPGTVVHKTCKELVIAVGDGYVIIKSWN